MQLQRFIFASGLVFLLFPLISIAAFNEPLFGVKPVWMITLPALDSRFTLSSPALAPDGTVYQGAIDGELLAITPAGKTRWKFKAALEIRSSPAVAEDGTIYFGDRDGQLYAVTPQGELKWTFATEGWVDSSPAISADGTVYFGSWDKIFYAVTPGGKLKWKFRTGGIIFSSPAIGADGTIYFGSHDKSLYALDPQGQLKWKFTTGGMIQSSPAIGADGTIYITSLDGNLHAVKPDGKELWHLHTGDYLSASPVLDSRGYIYLSVSSNNYPYHASIDTQGKFRWIRQIEYEVEETGAVAANGQLYIATGWQELGALTTDKTENWGIWHPWAFKMRFNLDVPPNIAPDGTAYGCDGWYLFAVKPDNATPVDGNSSWPMWRANPQHTGRVAHPNQTGQLTGSADIFTQRSKE